MHHLKPLGELKLEVLSGNAQLGSKSAIFLSHVTLKFNGWPWKAIGHLFYATLSFVHHFKAIGEFKLELVWKCSIRVKIGDFSSQICWMTLKNNRASLLCCFKLCASFQTPRWIKTKVTVQKRSIWVKIGDLLSCVTLKFDRWPFKTIEHLFYVASSFVHHFITISEFKLKLQSLNAQFGSKSVIFLSHVTLKFDQWPWKTIEHLFYATTSFVHHFIAIGEFKLELQSGDTQFGLKEMIFLAVWPWSLTDDLEKQ